MKRSLSSRIAQCKQNLKSKLESLKARRQESFRLTPEEEAGWDAYLLEKDIVNTPDTVISTKHLSVHPVIVLRS